MLNDISFAKVKTEDGLELHGIVSGKIKDSNVIIHTHGLAGNFYENRFIYEMAEAYRKENICFISFNNRGHDYISDILKESNNEITFLRLGGAHDQFEDCLKDIKAWIKFSKDNGARNIILQGHSVGAAKVTYFILEKIEPQIKGLILLSPSDDISWGKAEMGDNFNKLIKQAEKMINSNLGDDLIPYKSFSYPMDAKTFLRTFGGKTMQSIFHKPLPKCISQNEMKAIDIPILITIGTVNEAYVGSPENYMTHLKELFQPNFVTIKKINGAGHSYIGYEKELITEIIIWMKHIFKM